MSIKVSDICEMEMNLDWDDDEDEFEVVDDKWE